MWPPLAWHPAELAKRHTILLPRLFVREAANRRRRSSLSVARNELGYVPPAAKGIRPSGLPHAHAGYVGENPNEVALGRQKRLIDRLVEF